MIFLTLTLFHKTLDISLFPEKNRQKNFTKLFLQAMPFSPVHGMINADIEFFADFQATELLTLTPKNSIKTTLKTTL